MSARMTLVAALDRRRAIGLDNAMPWHLPDDLKRFKARTLGHPVLMGRRTALALGRALPGRRNLVLTRGDSVPFDGMERAGSLEHARVLAGDAELMVIGGGEVYALALPHAHAMLLTHVDSELPRADTWFPEFDPMQWRITARESHAADARHAFAFEFVDYSRP